MVESRSDVLVDRSFRVTLIFKGLDGLLELVGGILFTVVSPDQINDVVRTLTAHELSEDPNDVVANALVHAAARIDVSAASFASLYLLLHGLSKVVLVGFVMRGHLWAYPALIAFLLTFIAYQIYRLQLDFGWGLLLLTLFDCVMVVLTWLEYRRRKSMAGASPAV